MANVSMAALLAQAESEGFSSKDLPNGEFDATIDRTMVKPGKVDGDSRLLVTYKALSGAGTVLDGQNFMPSNPKSLFYWFRFLDAVGISKEFVQNNPGLTVEQVGQILEKNPPNLRIRVQQQANNPQYREVEIIGKATGEPDAAQQSAPSAPSAAAAPTPPAPPSGAEARPW